MQIFTLFALVCWWWLPEEEPHRASQDDEWEGYSIPAGALILVKVLVNILILCGQEAPCKFTLGTGSTL